MSWVRYDDQLEFNAKVTKAILADPGSMSLHLLANTWTSKSRHKGYVPRHQPGALLCDREIGAKFADIMVMCRLWHDVHDMCPECAEEYADGGLPADADGWVFHNHREYRPPAGHRQTPGTPTDLSAKRAEAGRRGGRTTAERRSGKQTGPANEANGQANEAKLKQNGGASGASFDATTGVDGVGPDGLFSTDESAQIKQRARANQANGASKTSKASSNSASPGPVPDPGVASNEATQPPVGDATASRQSGTGTKSAPVSASAVVAAFIDAATAAGQDKPTTAIVNRVGKDAKRLIGEKVDFTKLLDAAERIGRAGWDSLDRELLRMSAERAGRSGHDPPRHDGRSVSTEDELKDWEKGREVV